MLDQVLKTIDGREHQSLDMLKTFLSIPSVSTKPEHQPDMIKCATWIADQLRFAGLDAAIMETGGHPAVVAKNKHVPGRPTVLMYGHYDVQPPEPLDLWTTAPFVPTVRDGAIYARGAADDKGQVWAHIEAVTAWQAHGGLPVNITMLIEGEEEIGSKHLKDFVKRYKNDLKADIAVVSDTNQFAKGMPAITYGLRGLAYMEVKITGPSHDLHSGLFGGTVANPANVLCKVLGSLHDEDGRVTIEGFYDDVIKLTPDERAEWGQLTWDDQRYKNDVGSPNLWGEKDYTTLERKWARPTLDINGLTSGYQGPGAKTVLPSVASAKVSMRLVPNQDPAKIAANFEETIRQRCPNTVTVEVSCHSHTPGVLVPRQSQAIQLAAEALQVGFGTKPTFMREGGSIPVVNLFKTELGIDTLLVGFGLDDDRIHSPNEKFELDALQKGTRTCAVLYDRLSKLTAPTHAK
ncbi:MAG TPA: dipeptidase [Tepidisphaeraceae bacterium]|jgi:acetylornithine deacetylase/succinyl-diaminopimelate desuccinylase-like protein